MKNFKTPLAIEGSKEELEALMPELEKLGYVNSGWNYASDCPFLLTKFALRPNNFGFNQIRCGYFTVSASNKGLVLALAAMVDSEELYAGEWCVLVDEVIDFTIGNFYKAHKDGWRQVNQFKDDRGMANGFAPENKRVFRKATKEEIINYFMPKVNIAVENNIKNMGKKIIGYKVKEGVSKEAAALAIGFPDLGNSIAFYYDSLATNIAKERGILGLLFEPVYVPKEKTIIVKAASGEFKVKVFAFSITVDGERFSIEALKLILSHRFGVHKVNTYYDVSVNSVNIGCKIGIPLSSIQEIVDAYNEING